MVSPPPAQPPRPAGPRRTSAWCPRAADSCKDPAHPQRCHPGSAKATSTFTVSQFRRTGFRGALNYYRNIDRNWEILGALAGMQVSVPALYIAGDRDFLLLLSGYRPVARKPEDIGSRLAQDPDASRLWPLVPSKSDRTRSTLRSSSSCEPCRAAHDNADSPTESSSPGNQAAKVQQMAMLGGPVLPTLLKLALPTVVVLVVQTLVGVAETYFVSFLGTEALAGVSLVFPIFMLMQMMSNGGIGGGVASSIARAMGAGKVAEAEALALNALVLAVVFGVIFAAAEWLFGEAVYRLLGGQAGALGAALEYGHVIFSGAVFVWIVSLLAAALRGAGNTVAPAAVILLGVFVLLPLSPALIFGWGPFPRLGVAGAGARGRRLLSRRRDCVDRLHAFRQNLVAPALDARLIKWRLLGDILRVGGLSAIGTIQANLTVVLVTGAVGLFGTDAPSRDTDCFASSITSKFRSCSRLAARR